MKNACSPVIYPLGWSKKIVFVCVLSLLSNLLFAQTQWLQGGNAFGAPGVLGTTDANPLDFYTNNLRIGRWTPGGNLLVNTTTDAGPSYKLQVNGTAYATGYYGYPFMAFADGAGTPYTNGRNCHFAFIANHNWGNNSATPTDFFDIQGTLSYTANVNPGPIAFLNLSPTFNVTATGFTSTVRGIYYNPVITSLPSARHIAVETVSGDVLLGTSSGNVGIGTSNPQSKLAVLGTITTQKIVVTQTGWADYVFDRSYRLPALPMVEKFIQEHKHLPDLPTAGDIDKAGNDLGSNQIAMLKKIEELTLYVIEQDKQLKALQKEVTHLRKSKMSGK